MKFVISSSALLSLLQATGRVINSKNTLPILDYFLFDLRDGMLKVTASDLETTMVGTIKVDNIEKEGIIAIPSKLMLDSLKEFSEQPLTIEANESTWEIKMSWKSGSLAIPGTSGLSYPEMPTLSGEYSELRFDADALVNGINKTIFATAEDEMRPVLNGIYIAMEPNMTTFVATDAHKLVKHTVERDNGDTTSTFVLPKKPAMLLKAILSKEEAVKIAFDAKNAQFSTKNFTMVCRLIEGNFPNYNAVIPSNNPNKVIMDRVELINSIRRVAVCSNQATNLIRLDFSANSVALTAQDLDFSVSANEHLACSYDGDLIAIGFKSTFLVEMLSNIETPSVTLELGDSTRAGVFKPIYDDKQTSTTLMLLMPMMINN